jgi:GntR family transcriptional repressor for pyruvate dehydrogenase complex
MTLISSLEPGDPALLELLSATLEVRRILASEAIALAAKRRTEDDIRAIAECAEAMKTKIGDPLAYARADVVFMRVVVRAARNVGLELLLNTFARFPDEQPGLVVSLYDRCAEAVALYPLLVELIRGGDADIARETVRRALERMDEAWAERHAPRKPKSDAKASRRKR